MDIVFPSSLRKHPQEQSERGPGETMHRERDQEIRRRRKRREKALKRRIKELKAEAKVRKAAAS